MREDLERAGDLVRYLLAPRKTLVLLVCSMRSGSTLLKALLGGAPDVSHLPEVPFHKVHANRFAFYTRFCRLAPEPIIVLKHPLWFTDSISGFPVPRLARVRMVGLVRDCYPTLCSVKAMPADDKPTDAGLIDYWLRCTSQVLAKIAEAGARGRVLRYEDLLADPIAVSSDLFRFIGSSMREGTREYRAPAQEWQWGSDDGGDKIRSRVVQSERAPSWDPALHALIEADGRVAELRARLGYDTCYPEPQ